VTSPGALVCHSKSIGLSADRFSILSATAYKRGCRFEDQGRSVEDINSRNYADSLAWPVAQTTTFIILCLGLWSIAITG
jgi:hypothetical protein